MKSTRIFILALCNLALVLTASYNRLNAQSIAGGKFFTLTICSDGTVWSSGFNARGQLGNDTTINSVIFIQASIGDVRAVSAGGENSMALKTDSTVWAWGLNDKGQFGNGATSGSNPNPTPVQVLSLSGITKISAGWEHCLALDNNGIIWAWGGNYYGQLGDGTTSAKTTPFQVPGLSNIVSIAASEHHSMALENNGKVWVWGYNSNGQIGNGNSGLFLKQLTPFNVSSLNSVNIIDITAGSYSSMALASDSTLWVWGRNGDGQLGDNSNIDRLNPVHLTSISGIIDVDTKGFHSIALAADGQVWTWGRNSGGQLGNGSTTLSNSPVLLTKISDVSEISTGSQSSIALKNDGTLWTWGNNIFGELGNSTTTDTIWPSLAQLSCLSTSWEDPDYAPSQAELLAFPNPFHTSTTVEFRSQQNSLVTFELYNSAGQLKRRFEKISNGQLVVDRNDLTNGLYFYILKTEKELIGTGKLIVN